MSVLDDHPQARSVFAPVIAGTTDASHAYLLHGPPGSGRSEVAALLAGHLLDPAGGATDRVAARTHPDLVWVTPEGANGEVLVDDIRDRVIGSVSLTPFESRRRVFVIEGADRMNESAANAFLKTLEEPPSFVHLILTADSLDGVMPTIRSRCQTVRLSPPGVARLAERLEGLGVAATTALECASLAEGDGARAVMLASQAGPALRDSGELLARAALDRGAATAKPWVALLAAAKQIGDTAAAEVEQAAAERLETAARSERSRIEDDAEKRARRARRRAEGAAVELSLFIAESWLRDLQRACLGASDLIADDRRRTSVMQLAGNASPVRIRSALEMVSGTRKAMGLNVSRDLALESLAHQLDGALG